MRKVISNTTPLIGLADIGCLDVLQKLYQNEPGGDVNGWGGKQRGVNVWSGRS